MLNKNKVVNKPKPIHTYILTHASACREASPSNSSSLRVAYPTLRRRSLAGRGGGGEHVAPAGGRQPSLAVQPHAAELPRQEGGEPGGTSGGLAGDGRPPDSHRTDRRDRKAPQDVAGGEGGGRAGGAAGGAGGPAAARGAASAAAARGARRVVGARPAGRRRRGHRALQDRRPRLGARLPPRLRFSRQCAARLSVKKRRRTSRQGPSEGIDVDGVRPLRGLRRPCLLVVQVIEDLNRRLDSWRNPTKPLENAQFTYGMNTDYLQKVVTFWRTKYNWRQREAILNSLPQFKTNIAGLDIHFIRTAPSKVPPGTRVLPLLLLHGWPGSVRSVFNLIPLLTAPRQGHDFVFEVVAPSLPGFGFSDAAVRPGLGAAQIGLVMKKLMHRLGFDKFYIEAEDFGALVGSDMASIWPDVVLGAHMNMCPLNHPMMHILGMVGWFFPSLVVEEKYMDRVYPVFDKLAMFVEESGYCHIQATKPDTVGVGLSDSPVGLAAYILEKFAVWTNKANKFLPDGGIEKKFSLEELLDNVMIYWITDSITTTMRLYAETFSPAQFALGMDKIPANVPVVCVAAPHDVVYAPRSALTYKYPQLVDYSHPPRGGHFLMLEEPGLFADDVWRGMAKILKSKRT